MPASRQLILDMDLGIDDALAVLYLAAQPDLDIVAAGSVHGNTPADFAAGNLLRVLALAGRADVPVALGASRPLVRELHLGAEVHGADGLGDTVAGPAPGAVTGESAPEQLVRLAREAPGRYDVLATGPLTNLAIALMLEPALPRLVRAVTVMGGAATVPGNMSPTAEANIWHDPEAARLVFEAPWPVTMVGLDVTTQTLLDEAAVATIAAAAPHSERARFVTAILRCYLDFYERITGRRACSLHDPSAAAVYADPSLATTVLEADVTVACADDARGTTIVDRRAGGGPVETPRAPATRVVLGLDAGRFVPDLVRILTS